MRSLRVVDGALSLRVLGCIPKPMTQLPSTKLCKFLRLERKRLSGVGLAQQRLVSLQRCTMLEQLQNKSATEHAEVCARLLAAGGKSAITTLCEFNGLPPCPTREEA